MRLKGLALATVAAAALALPLTHGVSAATSGVSASAAGSGTLDFGGLRTFSFAATARNGAAQGQAQVDNRANGVRAHVIVSCLVVAGNTAYVGGTIDSSTNPDLVGAPVLFGAQDNGAGAQDMITGLFAGDSDCTSSDNQSEIDDSLVPVQHGNVQVR